MLLKKIHTWFSTIHLFSKGWGWPEYCESQHLLPETVPEVFQECQASHSHLLSVRGGLDVLATRLKLTVSWNLRSNLDIQIPYQHTALMPPLEVCVSQKVRKELNTVNPAKLLWQNHGFPIFVWYWCNIKTTETLKALKIWRGSDRSSEAPRGFDHSFTETRLPSVELGWVMPLTVVFQLNLAPCLNR